MTTKIVLTQITAPPGTEATTAGQTLTLTSNGAVTTTVTTVAFSPFLLSGM
jgi:hypothetical protein